MGAVSTESAAIEIIAAICAIVVITKYSELEQAIAYQLRDGIP